MNNFSQDPGKHHDRSFSQWVKTHDVFIFFLLTFVITFGAWLAAMATGVGAVFDFGLWGPALAAILVIALTRGRPGLNDLFRRLVLWRVPARWYLIVFIGWPTLMILAALVHAQMTGQALKVEWDNWSGFLAFLASAPVLAFWACEEIGWRGFALPRLLEQRSALLSSVILGILWALWHLPYFLGVGGLNPAFYLMPLFTVSISVLMTWAFQHTKGSLFFATFTHFWINVYSGLQADKLPSVDPDGEALVQYILLAGIAVALVALYGYRSFTRHRQGATPVELKTRGA